MSKLGGVRFTQTDLAGIKKKELASIIQAQDPSFNPKAKVNDMRAALLNPSPSNPFYKVAPSEGPLSPQGSESRCSVSSLTSIGSRPGLSLPAEGNGDVTAITTTQPTSHPSSVLALPAIATPPAPVQVVVGGPAELSLNAASPALTITKSLSALRPPGPASPAAEIEHSPATRHSESEDSQPHLPLASAPASRPSEAPSRYLGEVGVQANSNAELEVYYILIEDGRFNPARKSAVYALSTPRYATENDSVIISALDVVSQIQKSGSPITGEFRLSTPYRFEESFNEFFAVSTDADSEPSPTIYPNQDDLYLPANKQLRIRVHHLAGDNRECATISNLNTIGLQDSLASNDQRQSNSRLSAKEQAPAPQSVSRTRHRKKGNSQYDTTVEWLRTKLVEHADYSLVQQSHGRTIQNPIAVSVWKFVADFHSIYFTTKSDVSGSTVTKKAIIEAFNYGETWYSDCLAGHRLVSIYGRGGSHMDGEVVNELESVRDVPKGRCGLLRFLQEWERDHPCR